MATLKDIITLENFISLQEIVSKYKIKNFVETGTGYGSTIIYAIDSNVFENIYTIEIYPEVAERAKIILEDRNCHFFIGHSAMVLRNLIPNLVGNSLFFLDAHFPGADFGFKKYKESETNLDLPLSEELEVITSIKNIDSDIFIIDDMRIYEKGDYGMGNLSIEEGAIHSGLEFIYSYFDNHNINVYKNFTGFLTAFPIKNE